MIHGYACSSQIQHGLNSAHRFDDFHGSSTGLLANLDRTDSSNPPAHHIFDRVISYEETLTDVGYVKVLQSGLKELGMWLSKPDLLGDNNATPESTP